MVPGNPGRFTVLPRRLTGLPLPLYWKGVGVGEVSTKVIAMILMPGMLLLALGLYAITLQRAIERRLPLDKAPPASTHWC